MDTFTSLYTVHKPFVTFLGSHPIPSPRAATCHKGASHENIRGIALLDSNLNQKYIHMHITCTYYIPPSDSLPTIWAAAGFTGLSDYVT